MTDTLDRLNETLLDIDAPDAATEDGFRIENDDQAAWVSRKLAATYEELNKIDAWEERQKTRIEEVANQERKQHTNDREWWEALLHTYLADLTRSGRKKKTLELPGGTVRLRKRQPRLHFEDQEATLEFLRHTNPDLIRTKEDIDLASFRKHVHVDGSTVVLTDTGDVLETVTAEPQGDSVSFTPAKETE